MWVDSFHCVGVFELNKKNRMRKPCKSVWADPFRSAGVFELNKNIVRKRCKPVFSIIIRRGGMVGRESGEELRGRAQEVGG